MTLESKENYPRHTKTKQNSLGFMPEVKPLHKRRGDLVLCALYWYTSKYALHRRTCVFANVYSSIWGLLDAVQNFF